MNEDLFEWALNAFLEDAEGDDNDDEAPPNMDDDGPDEDSTDGPPPMDDQEATDETEDQVEPEEPEQEEEKHEKPAEKPKAESLPKKTDKAEADKNGIRRKNLYVAFINWAKEYNRRNTFGSIFDKDAFHVSYPFVPDEMRYFYRLANPLLCVLAGDLTFFPVSELRKLNSKNKQMDEMLIFAATPNDLRVFNRPDKKVYRAEEENETIVLKDVLGDTFDMYIQNMIGQGDILNGPNVDTTKQQEDVE